MTNCPKSHYTYTEIMHQPQMWLKQYRSLIAQRDVIETFVSKYLDLGYGIIYAGAGTSAFIGNILEFALSETAFRGGRSVPTTDLITNPETYLSADSKVLLISFARSGNSPESLGAIKIANSICRNIAHIYITCNEEGELAKTAHGDNTLLLLLPPETNDRSLAMTSSFSTMLFTCMALADIANLETNLPLVESLVEHSTEVLQRYDEQIKSIAEKSFERAIFLGSGELLGVAEESRLKLQELTDGEVVCIFDSYLGFRHGPQAVVNSRSLLVYLVSEDSDIRRYETDLIGQINSNNNVVAQVVVSNGRIGMPGIAFDLEVAIGGGKKQHGIFNCIPYVFTAQLLGYYKSLAMGLDPDSPSVSGNISRVVEGVTIYF